jgi:hypothetical protein
MSRSSSKEGNEGSGVDPFAVVQETERRRKRDMIVRALSKRRRNGQGAIDVDVDALIESAGNDRTGDGRGATDHPIDGRGEDQDENAGQYVNYQVGFEYKRTELAKRRGWGLHVLVSEIVRSVEAWCEQASERCIGVLRDRGQGSGPLGDP